MTARVAVRRSSPRVSCCLFFIMNLFLASRSFTKVSDMISSKLIDLYELDSSGDFPGSGTTMSSGTFHINGKYHTARILLKMVVMNLMHFGGSSFRTLSVMRFMPGAFLFFIVYTVTSLQMLAPVVFPVLIGRFFYIFPALARGFASPREAMKTYGNKKILTKNVVSHNGAQNFSPCSRTSKFHRVDLFLCI